MSSKASTNYDTITGLETAGLAFAGRWIHGARLVHLRGLRGVPLGEQGRREVRGRAERGARVRAEHARLDLERRCFPVVRSACQGVFSSP